MNRILSWFEGQRDTSILILRVILATILIVAGYQKLFGGGITEFTGYLAGHGIVLSPLFGILVPVLEFFGGIAILLGLFTRYVAILIAIQFVYISVHYKPILVGGSSVWKSVRIDLTLAAMAILLITHGGGRLALDRILFRK